jgi:hypothetical protein
MKWRIRGPFTRIIISPFVQEKPNNHEIAMESSKMERNGAYAS